MPVDLNRHSREEQAEEWGSRYVSLPFLWFFYRTPCLFSGKLLLDTQESWNSFKCQSKAKNTQVQQRGQFLPVSFFKKEGPLLEAYQQTSTHVSLSRILSHVHANPLTGKGNDSTIISVEYVRWKFFWPTRTYHGLSSMVSWRRVEIWTKLGFY